MRILIVEDEPSVGRSLQRGLAAERIDVTLAASGEEGFYLVLSEIFDLMVLDLMLPGRDGIDILRALRGRGLSTPVIVVSARDAVEDRVRGLDVGADDYLVKPFAFEELLARIRALLRRGRAQDVLRLVVGDLELDRVTRCVARAGLVVDLTVREYDLLEYLMSYQGRVVSREMLVRDIWREPRRVTPLDNVIDVHMARLRKKVDNGHAHALIHTVRGVGFVLPETPP